MISCARRDQGMVSEQYGVVEEKVRPVYIVLRTDVEAKTAVSQGYR